MPNGFKKCSRESTECEPGCKRISGGCYPTMRTLKINTLNDSRESYASVGAYYALMSGFLALIGAVSIMINNDTFPRGKGSSLRVAQASVGVIWVGIGGFMIRAYEASKNTGNVNASMTAVLTLWSSVILALMIIFFWSRSFWMGTLLGIMFFILGILACYAAMTSDAKIVSHDDSQPEQTHPPILEWWAYSLMILFIIFILTGIGKRLSAPSSTPSSSYTLLQEYTPTIGGAKSELGGENHKMNRFSLNDSFSGETIV